MGQLTHRLDILLPFHIRNRQVRLLTRCLSACKLIKASSTKLDFDGIWKSRCLASFQRDADMDINLHEIRLECQLIRDSHLQLVRSSSSYAQSHSVGSCRGALHWLQLTSHYSFVQRRPLSCGHEPRLPGFPWPSQHGCWLLAFAQAAGWDNPKEFLHKKIKQFQGHSHRIT